METRRDRRRDLHDDSRRLEGHADALLHQQDDHQRDLERRQLRSNARTEDSVKIVVADDLPESALELLGAEAGWQIDAKSGRSPADLAKSLADADALLVRSATKVTADVLRAAPCLRI